MIRAEKSHILSDGLFFDQVNIGYQPHLQVVGNQIMEMFNFISDEDFRTSLEADYQELTLCMNAGAWKAVHVLAGSIVETLLIDYLVATEYEKRSSRKLSAMNFFEIIDICKKEHALSSKSADLSNAIREYRNLIHPEKLRRLGEKVDENSAAVVQALVKMVVEDVSKRRSEEVGLTAEQLVAKIERDRSANSILKHLLEKTSSFEKRRLLLKIIPNRYLELSQEMIEAESPRMRGFTTTLNDLELCFRLAFDAASKGTKEEVTNKFVKVLKEETTRIVSIYEETFFRGGDLEYLSSENRTMVKEHFLSRLMVKQTSNIKLMAASEGIGKFLTHREAQMFVDAVVRVMVYGENEMEWEPTKEVLLAELQRMDPQILSAITSRIGYWIHTFNAKKQIEAAKTCTRMIEAVQNQIAYNSLPDFPDE